MISTAVRNVAISIERIREGSPISGRSSNATAMAVKAARILLGTAAFGGPNFLSDANVQRIYTRPDEKYREKGILGR